MHHIGLVVSDLQRSTDFYLQAFDLEKGEAFSSDNLAIQYLKTDTVTLELLQFKDKRIPPSSTGYFDHIAFVVNDIVATISKLQTMGIKITESPRLSMNGSKIVFFHGPDGERLELMEEGKIN